MTDSRDLQRLEREEWFVEMRRAYDRGIVESMDGFTYQGRRLLPRDINIAWVRARLIAAKVESASPGWILGILEEQTDQPEDPLPIPPEKVLPAIIQEWG